MRLRTDDDIYRARLVYLGPPGYALPMHLPYAQYGLFVVLVPLFWFIHYLITFQFDPFPAWAYEVLFVSKRVAHATGPAAPGPHPLDAPNAPYDPDCQAPTTRWTHALPGALRVFQH